jgi:hypothetical protein
MYVGIAHKELHSVFSKYLPLCLPTERAISARFKFTLAPFEVQQAYLRCIFDSSYLMCTSLFWRKPPFVFREQLKDRKILQPVVYQNKWEGSTRRPMHCDQILIYCKLRQKPGSSVNIVSDYVLDDLAIEVRSPAGAKDFSSSLCARLALRPTQHPVQWVPGVISPGRDGDHSPHLLPR